MTFIELLEHLIGNDPSGGVLYGVFGGAFVLICISSILAFVFGFVDHIISGGRR